MLLTSVVLSPFAFPVWPMGWSFKTSPLQTSDPTFCISLHSVHNFAFNLTEEIDAIRRYHPLSSCYYIYLSVFVYAPCILIFLYYGVNWPCFWQRLQPPLFSIKFHPFSLTWYKIILISTPICSYLSHLKEQQNLCWHHFPLKLLLHISPLLFSHKRYAIVCL